MAVPPWRHVSWRHTTPPPPFGSRLLFCPPVTGGLGASASRHDCEAAGIYGESRMSSGKVLVRAVARTLPSHMYNPGICNSGFFVSLQPRNETHVVNIATASRKPSSGCRCRLTGRVKKKM
ncbi:hypothetical protein GGTG_02624 [Gaeumannomyces tritici R3-111a-1]|uniref:Uncharacterized protein n=1 Tax=Gaeumannomyces tritici (strain R3-111a-1) TaxID=644352 RepID=J3NMW6_GAET3|nr:hypothetical protein GGTG_02624 [Gaeumannomyces tritici R3-111a-1]EJT77517.1 hypothetical protein GGTG_02624 [Gaeumannomyces tritici R3-111a-1]